MTDHSTAITKNNGDGSNNHLSWLQHGSVYRQEYVDRQNSGDPGDSKENVTPILFAAVSVALLLLRVLCIRLQKEEEAGGGDREGQPPPPPLPPSRGGAGGLGDRDPFPSVVAAVEMAPVVPVQPPLVCTYRKADGWGDDSCGVCLAELADGEALRVLPVCMHFFHAACVNEWLRRHDTCPLCRAPLVAPADNT